MSEIKEKLEGELKTIKSISETMENAIKSEIDKGLDKINTHELYEASDILKDASEIKLNCVKSMYYMQIMEAMEKEEKEEKEEDKYMLQRMKEDYGEEEGQRYYNEYRYANGRYAPKGRGRRRRYTEPRYLTAPEVMPVVEPMVEPVAYYRDMDRETMNKMYYGMGGSSGGSGSRGYSDMRGESNRSNVRSYEDGYSEGNTRGFEDGYSKGDSDGYNRGFSEGRRSSGNNTRDYREGRSGRNRRTYIEAKETKDNSPESKQMKMKELERYTNELSSDITEMIGDASPEEKNLLKNKLQNLTQKI